MCACVCVCVSESISVTLTKDDCERLRHRERGRGERERKRGPVSARMTVEIPSDYTRTAYLSKHPKSHMLSFMLLGDLTQATARLLAPDGSQEK